ncbi:unnamed protein product [Darwinula stevensoni]|uniref:Uncharacterized protein n=1 Tax=Darwinula stevensoni TaxID=69355 RepID=A0A7R8X8K5_9CRUS|nr:unnamed protein product [Darwinula stevensoni]CAG0888195.1 unnamed protein product [Darwinula stevensoni]
MRETCVLFLLLLHSYKIMWKCWDVDPKERPHFSVLGEWLGDMMEKSEHQVCYKIMWKCWDVDPKERPHFSVLGEWLGDMMEKSEHQRYEELNKRFKEANSKYFQMNTDYLQMMSVPMPEYGYLRPRQVQHSQSPATGNLSYPTAKNPNRENSFRSNERNPRNIAESETEFEMEPMVM